MKNNPTRRGNISIPNKCLCGWSRIKKRYVTNGCPIHKKETNVSLNFKNGKLIYTFIIIILLIITSFYLQETP